MRSSTPTRTQRRGLPCGCRSGAAPSGYPAWRCRGGPREVASGDLAVVLARVAPSTQRLQVLQRRCATTDVRPLVVHGEVIDRAATDARVTVPLLDGAAELVRDA